MADEYSVYHQFDPGRAVVRGFGQHVQITTRDGDVQPSMVKDAGELAWQCWMLETEPRDEKVFVRLRTLWFDRSLKCVSASIDLLGTETALAKQKIRSWDRTNNNWTHHIEF